MFNVLKCHRLNEEEILVRAGFLEQIVQIYGKKLRAYFSSSNQPNHSVTFVLNHSRDSLIDDSLPPSK